MANDENLTDHERDVAVMAQLHGKRGWLEQKASRGMTEDQANEAFGKLNWNDPQLGRIKAPASAREEELTEALRLALEWLTNGGRIACKGGRMVPFKKAEIARAIRETLGGDHG